MIESKEYDCSRGCTVERAETGEVECNYRQGCCKLEVYDWLQGINQEQFNEFFEVREKARLVLIQNKRGEAQKMLTDLFKKQYQEAQDLLTAIEKKTAHLPAVQKKSAAPAAPEKAKEKK